MGSTEDPAECVGLTAAPAGGRPLPEELLAHARPGGSLRIEPVDRPGPG